MVLAWNRVVSAGEPACPGKLVCVQNFFTGWQHFLWGEGGGDSFLLALTLMDVCWRAET